MFVVKTAQQRDVNYFGYFTNWNTRFSSKAAVETWDCHNILAGKPYCNRRGKCYAGPFDADYNNRYHLYYGDIVCK